MQFCVAPAAKLHIAYVVPRFFLCVLKMGYNNLILNTMAETNTNQTDESGRNINPVLAHVYLLDVEEISNYDGARETRTDGVFGSIQDLNDWLQNNRHNYGLDEGVTFNDVNHKIHSQQRSMSGKLNYDYYLNIIYYCINVYPLHKPIS